MDDRKFMEELENLRGKVYSHTRNLFGTRIYGYVHIEDIVQETMIKAYQGRHSFRPTNNRSLRNWVLRINTNNFLNFLRKINRSGEDKNKPLEESVEEMDDCDLEVDFIEKESFYEFISFIFDLLNGKNNYSDSQKRNIRTFLVKELSGYSYNELSEFLNRSDGSLKSSWNRGKKILQKVLTV